MKATLFIFILTTTFISQISTDPSSDLKAQIDHSLNSRSWKGIQLQITKKGESIFYHNNGIKNQKNETINSDTIFRIASCSKSFTSVAIMQLVEQGKIRLNDTLSKHLGFEVKHPKYPDVAITIQMLLSHQSSIAETSKQYGQFTTDIHSSPNGSSIPSPRQILVEGGKYYNPQIFPAGRKPGQYFHYSNLGYMIAGTIVEIITQKRFDIYMIENVLAPISEGLAEYSTHNPVSLKNPWNLAVLYRGNQGKWYPNYDNYNGTIPQKNLTFYKLGTNAGVFSPQAGVRASVKHMNNYMYMLANKGLLKSGKRLLSQESVNQILRPRYQYHGIGGGPQIQMHLYGLGIYTTTYDRSDIMLEHETIRGHTGQDCGLISGYSFWKDYTFSYIINGALYGYEESTQYIYEVDRMVVHQNVDKFIKSIQNQLQNNLSKLEQ